MKRLHKALFCYMAVIILVTIVFQGRSASLSKPLAFLRDSPPSPSEDESLCKAPGRATDPCAFVRENCSQIPQYFNYLELYYCSLTSDSRWSFYVLAIILILIFFSGLASLADELLAPTMMFLASVWGISEELTGVTLVALSNGAPDLASVVSAVQQKEFSMSVGEFFGSGLFISAVIFGSVCLFYPFSYPSASTFLLEVLSYLIGASFVFVILRTGFVNLFEAFGFLAYYVLFVVATIYVSRAAHRRDPALAPLISPECGDSNATDCRVLTDVIDMDDATDNRCVCHRYSKSVSELFHKVVFEICVVGCPRASHYKVVRETPKPHEVFKASSEWFLLPSFVLLYFNQLPLQWNILGVSDSVWLVAFAFGGILAVVMTPLIHVRSKVVWVCMQTVQFVYGILALDLVAGEIVALLHSFGLIFEIDPTVLSLTVLALGNSIGDFVTDLAIAEQQKPLAAVTACFAGPLFNMMIGLSLALIPVTIERFPRHFTFKPSNSYTILYIGLILNLLIILTTFIITRYRSHKSTGVILCSTYLVIIIFAIIF